MGLEGIAHEGNEIGVPRIEIVVGDAEMFVDLLVAVKKVHAVAAEVLVELDELSRFQVASLLKRGGQIGGADVRFIAVRIPLARHDGVVSALFVKRHRHAGRNVAAFGIQTVEDFHGEPVRQAGVFQDRRFGISAACGQHGRRHHPDADRNSQYAHHIRLSQFARGRPIYLTRIVTPQNAESCRASPCATPRPDTRSGPTSPPLLLRCHRASSPSIPTACLYRRTHARCVVVTEQNGRRSWPFAGMWQVAALL